MTTLKTVKYLSVVALAGIWGCSPNQNASRTGVVYDDLYGNPTSVEVAARTRSTQEINRYSNPDYAPVDGLEMEGSNADYYDETYLSTRNIQRVVSDQPGYNAGFQEGYLAGRNAAFDPFFMNSLRYGAFWPGVATSSAFNMGFQMGLSRSIRFGFSPFVGRIGMGWNSWGWNNWGWNSFAYSPWGYDPFMSGMGFYDPFYSPYGWGSMYGYGYGGWGYNPWGFSRPVLVINNYEGSNLHNRTYGPRGTNTATSRGSAVRSNQTYNDAFVNNRRTTPSSAGRANYESAGRGTSSNDAYYARPRANSGGTYYSNTDRSASGRTSAESVQGSSSNNNSYYYARPRANSSSSYSAGSSNRATRTYSETNSYSSGSRSNQSYQAPSRSSSSWGNNNSTPSYNNSNSNSGRSSAPTYSAPSRGSSSSSSAPASRPSAPSSRGPR